MMRTVRLAKVAARAETVRLRRLLLRSVRRVAFGAVATVFAIASLVLLHALGFEALTQFAGMAPFWAMLIVFAVDVVFAVIFGILAAGVVPDPIEREALALRQRSVGELRGALARDALLGGAGGLFARRSQGPGLGMTLGSSLVRSLLRRARR